MQRKSVATAVAITTLLGTGVAAVASSGASASTDRQSQTSRASTTEHFLITAINEKQGAVTHGLFTDAGKDVTKGNKDILHLTGGTVTIKHPNKQGHYTFHVNPKTCLATFTLRGKYTLISGTGDYAGVRGHGRYLGHGQGILKTKADGTCNQRADATYEVVYINASGPASMSS